MTQRIAKRLVLMGFLLAGSAAHAGEASFERMYEVQQKGYSEYFKGILKMGGKATPADAQRLKQAHIDPARKEADKARDEAGKALAEKSKKSLQGTFDLFARVKEAEKTGKKPEKPAVTKDTRTPAAAPKGALAPKLGAKGTQPEAPAADEQPAKAIDGKNLEDVIDF